ncbi:MAG: DNA-directed RNA polymerase subunit delta [Acholeplasmataceae bacterium]|nr:DNA-directed RNA polymerase subunit delta [Acholeplasmataceae bacterium]
MSDKLKSLAMLDVAESILRDNKNPMTIQQLIQKVAEIKEISLDDVDKLTQLYMDITQSGKFVFAGDDLWDLKERNLELWDKDGYAFVHEDEVEEELEEDLDFTEFTLEEEEEVEGPDEDEEEEVDEEIKEEKAYIEVELPTKSTDDEDVDDDPEIEFDNEDYDEDDYNEIMDDYEDMYDE